MSAKFIPLMECVAFFLDQHDKSGADEDKAWGMAFRALELMYYNTVAEPKTVRVPLLPNKTAQFPSDYVQWCKIGILNERTELITLIVNDKLTKFKSTNPNRLELLTADVNDGIGSGYLSNVYLNSWDGIGYMPLYGAGYGLQNFGECSVDENNNLIIFAPDFKYDSCVIEYISCPEKDTDYKIDRRLREAVIAFIEWKFKLVNRTEFYAAYEEANRQINPFEIQKFEQIIREQNKFCIKF